MSEPTIEQLKARERAEAWLAAGKRHAERGEDLLALGCFVPARENARLSDMSDLQFQYFIDNCVSASEQPKRRLADTMPEEGTAR